MDQEQLLTVLDIVYNCYQNTNSAADTDIKFFLSMAYIFKTLSTNLTRIKNHFSQTFQKTCLSST